MAGSRRIVIEFLGKDVSAGRTADQVEGRMSAVGGKLRKVGAVAAAGFAIAGAAAVKFGVDAIGSASDLNETLSKSNVIFGKQAPAMEKWASEAARAAGLSKQAALESAASFGDMFTQIGFGGREAAKMSKGVVQLSADLGSFNNLPTAEVTDMMSAAFRGEYDSLQRVIPNINAARVQTEALAMTGKKSAKELTAQEKAAATLAIVQKDGAKAAGDFARTSDGLANQQKILGAQFENVKASIGQKLLPVAVKAMQFFNDDAIPIIRDMSQWLSKHLGPAFEAIGRIVSSATGGMNGDVSKNMAAVSSTFSSVVSIWTSLWNRFGGNILSFLTTTFDNFRKLISGGLQVISGIFKVFAALLKGDWKGVWDGLKQIMSGAWTVIKAVISQALNVIKTLFKVAWSAIRGIVGGVWSGIKGLVAAGATAIVNSIKGIPGRVKALAGSFKEAGKHLIQSMVDGLKNAAGIISGIAGNVWDAVKRLLNGGIDRINAALEFKISLPGPDIGVNPPNIPHLAKGGIVRARRGGTLALLGEAGADEAVIPLSGPNAPRMSGGDVSVAAPLVLQLDSKTVWQGLLKMKRTGGIVELGLA